MIGSHRIAIIGTNPDAEDFDMNRLINQVYKHITQWNEGKLKEQENKIKEQKRKFAKELLSYVSGIWIPVKHINYFVKKILPTL